MLKLLVFAHRNEASAFFEHLHLKEVDFPHASLYRDDEHYLLITGEGPFNASMNLAYFLGSFKAEKFSVMNFGAAGTLSPSLKLDHVYTIKTCHGYFQKPLYHSYQLSGDKTLVTSDLRVTTLELAQKLLPLGEVVDREAYYFAQVCQHFKVDFYAIKYISDRAGIDTVCEDIRARAHEISNGLWNFYQKHPLKPKTDIQTNISIPKLDGFHMSFTQEKEFQKTLGKLCKKFELTPEEILDRCQLQRIEELKILPKEKSKKLLNNMKELLNPFKYKVESALDETIKPLTEIGAIVHFDPEMEKTDFKITMPVNSQKNLENLTLALKNIDYQKIENIFDGNF
jgi:hypothetical protein